MVFDNDRLDILEEEAIYILQRAKETNSVLSFSGGADSMVMHHINKKFNIGIDSIFTNPYIENKYNQKVIKEVSREYEEVIKVKTKTYKEIVWDYGFPIQNKEFSKMCYRIRANPLSINNVIDKYRILTSVSPYKVNSNKKIASMFYLEDKYWYLAMNYPIQEKCCNILKKQPASKIKRDMVIGIMKDDSPMRRQAINKSFHGKYFPLQNWTKKDIFEYARVENIQLSDIYKDRDIEVNREKITLCGATGSGCPACDFGQTSNHYIIKNGEKIKTTKFHKLELEYPKLYKSSMKMKHKSGVTFEEVIKVHRESKKGKYLKESIKIRSDFAKEVKRFLRYKENIPKEAFKLLDRYIIED